LEGLVPFLKLFPITGKDSSVELRHV